MSGSDFSTQGEPKREGARENELPALSGSGIVKNLLRGRDRESRSVLLVRFLSKVSWPAVFLLLLSASVVLMCLRARKYRKFV